MALSLLTLGPSTKGSSQVGGCLCYGGLSTLLRSQQLRLSLWKWL